MTRRKGSLREGAVSRRLTEGVFRSQIFGRNSDSQLTAALPPSRLRRATSLPEGGLGTRIATASSQTSPGSKSTCVGWRIFRLGYVAPPFPRKTSFSGRYLLCQSAAQAVLAPRAGGCLRSRLREFSAKVFTQQYVQAPSERELSAVRLTEGVFRSQIFGRKADSQLIAVLPPSFAPQAPQKPPPSQREAWGRGLPRRRRSSQ